MNLDRKHFNSSSLFMSSASPPPPSAGVGLGYGIAISVGILVLVSTIMLASYICVRVKGGAQTQIQTTNRDDSAGDCVVVLDMDAYYTKFVYVCDVDSGHCSICLSDFEDGEALRRGKECGHTFHAKCVEEWLRRSATCPICRSSPIPSTNTTPVATPLSEFIPLAAHAR